MCGSLHSIKSRPALISNLCGSAAEVLARAGCGIAGNAFHRIDLASTASLGAMLAFVNTR
jgi:hypothetical protein